MSQSQDDARVAALRALGYKVPTQPGLQTVVAAARASRRRATERHATVVARPSVPARGRCCSRAIRSSPPTGTTLKAPDDLSKIIKAHKPGIDGDARHHARRQADDREVPRRARVPTARRSSA